MFLSVSRAVVLPRERIRLYSRADCRRRRRRCERDTRGRFDVDQIRPGELMKLRTDQRDNLSL